VKLGLIARADNSGLGVQTWEFARHLQPAKTLVIDVGDLRDDTTHCNKATYRQRYNGATFHRGWTPGRQVLRQFLRGLDVVFTAETPYNMELFHLARTMNVRTVLQYNFEFLPHLNDPSLPKPDVFAGPTQWRWGEVPFDNKTLLPVPIALDRFGKSRVSVTSGTRHFLHIVGRPAVFDRNGTPDLLQALRHVTSNIRLTLKCQDRDYLNKMVAGACIPPNVDVTVDSGDVENYWDLYREGDVFLMPRKYGGLCLPAQEALGAGMPVVMTDIDPNNTWLPSEWLVPGRLVAQFHAMNRVDVYAPAAVELAAKIDLFAQDEEFFAAAKVKASELAQGLGWDALKPEYAKALAGTSQ
jgi:hypothetical protein